MNTVVITGISRGIGHALARKFLDAGYIVIGTSVSGTLDYSHERLTVYPLDLSKPDSIQACTDAIAASDARADIMIDNAGALFDDEVVELHSDLLRKTLEVNVIGTADLTEHLLPIMTEKSHILFVSSSAGSISETDAATHSHHPGEYPAYKISKAALNMYMRTLAMRMMSDPRSVTVSSVHPGWVRTDMGGDDAPMTPEEAADHIYKLAISRPETGQFWFKGEKYPW